MKKLLIGFGIIVVMALAIVLIVTQTRKGEKKIKIGIILPLTGSNAVDGEAAKQSIDLAFELKRAEFIKKGITLRFIYEDDKMIPNEGVNAAKKIIKIDKVIAIIGPFGSSVLLAVAPVAEQNRVVLISGSATNPKIKEAGDYIFRDVPPDDYQGKALSKFAYEVLKVKKAAILYMNNDYGVGLKNVIEREFPQLGGQIIYSEAFNPGETDFRSHLQKLKKTNPECAFLPSHHTEGALILRQAREMGIKIPFLGGDGIFRPELIDIASNAANNTYISSMSWRPDSYDPLVKEFVVKFKEKYGKEPNVFSAYYFDATNIILDAILNGTKTSDEIKSYLYQNEFMGVTGKTKFDRYGEVEKPIDIFKIENKKFQYVYTVKP